MVPSAVVAACGHRYIQHLMPAVIASAFLCWGAVASGAQSTSVSACASRVSCELIGCVACAAGKAVVHTYTAGNEPYSVWEGLERGSKEYEELKEQRAQTLWKVSGYHRHSVELTCGGRQ